MKSAIIEDFGSLAAGSTDCKQESLPHWESLCKASTALKRTIPGMVRVHMDGVQTFSKLKVACRKDSSLTSKLNEVDRAMRSLSDFITSCQDTLAEKETMVPDSEGVDKLAKTMMEILTQCDHHQGGGKELIRRLQVLIK